MGVHHHVPPPAGGDDAREHQLEALDGVATRLHGGPSADEDGLRREQLPDRPEPVRAHRGARRDEVDNRVCQTEARRRLNRPGHGNQLALDSPLREQAPSRDRVRGRDAEAVELGDLALTRVCRHRRLQCAAREAELGQHEDVRIRLRDEVRARDADVDDAILCVLGNVAGSDEQEVDGRVGARHDERALGHLERETGVRAEPERRLGHATLGRDGQGQPAVLAGARELAPSSSRPPPPAGALERDPIPPGPVLEPLRYPCHGRGGRRHTRRDLDVGHASLE